MLGIYEHLYSAPYRWNLDDFTQCKAAENEEGAFPQAWSTNAKVHHWLIVPSRQGRCWPLLKIYIIQSYWRAKYKMYRKSKPGSVRYGWLLPSSLDLWELKFQVLIWNLLLSVTSKSKARMDCPFSEPARSSIIPEVPSGYSSLNVLIFYLIFFFTVSFSWAHLLTIFF